MANELPPNMNIADIEDYITAADASNVSSRDPASIGVYESADLTATYNYRRPGSFVSPVSFEKYTKALLAESQRLMGQGSPSNSVQNFLTRLDRDGNLMVPVPTLNRGFTFITRPRLNLSLANLMQTNFLQTLNSIDPMSVTFMIRALLDTKLCSGKGLRNYTSVSATGEDTAFSKAAINSGLIDEKSPFLTPVCNALKGISGYPDFNLEMETTEGDFHSGDFTMVKGSDMNKKTQELSLEFKDVKGNIVLALMYYWCTYMALQTKGVVVPYADDIFEQVLNYSVSIYRFVTDSSRKNILWWSKATGCWPKSVPVGSIFNVSQDEVTLSSATNFSIPFVANKIEYNDPAILIDFNILMKRYCPNIDTSNYSDLDYATIANQNIPTGVFNTPQSNSLGLPYVISDTHGLRLSWRALNSDIQKLTDQNNQTELDKIKKDIIGEQQTNMNSAVSSTGATS